MRKEFYIKNKKGQKICVVSYTKRGKLEKKPTVIFCHGFTGFKEEHGFKQFFTVLQKIGYQVVAFDMNAHGKSYGDFLHFTISKVLDDYKTVYNYVTKTGIKRIALAGYSLGGAASMLMANQLRIQCLILISPVTDRLFFKRTRLSLESQKSFLRIFGFLPRISFEKGKAYLIGKDFFTDFMKHQIRKKAKEIKKPILLIHAEKDQAVPLKEARELYKTFDFDITDFRIIKGAGHHYDNLKYQKQVINLSLNWFNKYLKKKRDDVMTVFLRRQDGKILIVKRSKKLGTYPGYWHGIGGYLEEDEKPRHTAMREVYEELGIEKKYLKIIKISQPYRWQDEMYDKDWNVYHILIDTRKTKLKLDWETEKAKWIWPKDFLKHKTIPNIEVGLKSLGLI